MPTMWICFKHKKHSLAYHSIHTCCFYVTGSDKSPSSHPPHAVSVCFSVANVPWLFSHFVISLRFELTLISIYLLGKSAANYIWLRDSLEFPASIIQVQACVASAVTLDLCCMTDAYPQGLPMLASTSCQDTGRKTWRLPCWSLPSCPHLSVKTENKVGLDASKNCTTHLLFIVFFFLPLHSCCWGNGEGSWVQVCVGTPFH